MDTHSLQVPMDSQNPGFWIDGGLTVGQRSTIRRLIADHQAGGLTVSELCDSVDAVRRFGVGMESLPFDRPE